MKRIAILALIFLALGGTARADQENTFHSLAEDILAELDRAPMGSLPASNGYGAPRIAVNTTTSEGKSSQQSDEITGRLLHALKQHAAGRYRFVATDALDDLIGSIKRAELSSEDANTRVQALRANARADIVVLGTHASEAGSSHVAYQAINAETGELLASARATFTQARRSLPSKHRPSAASRRTGVYRPTVKEAERLLLEKGYDPGVADGYLTEQTRRALRAYQLDSALPVNGRLTRGTVMNLRRDTRAPVL